MEFIKTQPYVTRDNLQDRCSLWLGSIEGLKGRIVPVDVKRPGLAVVDPQEIFVSESSPAYIPAWNAVAPNVFALIREFQKKKLPIIITRHAHKTGGYGGVLGHFFQKRVILEVDRLSEVSSDVISAVESPVVWIKEGHDCFASSLPEIFRGIDSLVLAGVQTPLCLAATAIGLARHGVVPLVIADGCAARDEESHVSSLRLLACGHAHVLSTAEVIKVLKEGF